MIGLKSIRRFSTDVLNLTKRQMCQTCLSHFLLPYLCLQSADDFSERSLRIAELTRDQRNLEEEVEDDSSLTETPDTGE